MSIDPRIAPDVFAHDASAHAGLVIGRDYMERERTSVIQPRRDIRCVQLPTLSVLADGSPIPIIHADGGVHDVREFAGKFSDGSIIVWGFAYCDHNHEAFTTFPQRSEGR